MEDEREEKRLSERYICDMFVSAYNKEYGHDLRIDREGLPHEKEPDFICTDGTGVEVTEVYANREEARSGNMMDRGKPDPSLTSVLSKRGFLYRKQTRPTRVSPGRIVGYMIERIMEKCEKCRKGNYDGCSGKVFLVCDALRSKSSTRIMMDEYMINMLGERVRQELLQDTNEKCFDSIFLIWGTPGNLCTVTFIGGNGPGVFAQNYGNEGVRIEKLWPSKI